MRQIDGGDDGGIGNADAMVLFHRPQNAAQHGGAARRIGLVDQDGLEAAGEGRILLEILAIFGPGGRGDGAQGAARQRRFEQVGGVSRPGRAAGADQRMRFIDEQDDRRRRGLHLVDDRAQPLLELALHRGARLHQTDVEGAELHPAQRRGHVARRDLLRKTFDDGGLADAGLAGEDRVVLSPPHQHVDDLADFFVAAKDRVHGAAAALAVRSCEKRSSAVVPFRAGRTSAPGVPAPLRPEPSIGRRLSSSESSQSCASPWSGRRSGSWQIRAR